MSVTRALHKLASPLLYSSGAYARHWRSRSDHEPFAIVLVYHRVVADGTSREGRFDIECGVPASVFEQQIRFMLKHFRPVRSSQVLEPSADRLRFAVTLDDGYEDNFSIAAPILARLDVPATFFVVSDYVGTDRLFWWEQLAGMMRASAVQRLDVRTAVPDLVASGQLQAVLPVRSGAERKATYERLCAVLRAGPHGALPRRLDALSGALGVPRREEGRDYGLMSWGQLEKLARRGFEIGAHTATHCNVTTADAEILRAEIGGSVAAIERRLERPVLTFAYPYGLYRMHDGAAAKAVAAAGCRLAFTGAKGVVAARHGALELPRARLNRRFHFACAYNCQDALNVTALASAQASTRKTA